jgi:hypothetical protein
MVSNTEISHLERELGQARTAALSSGAGVQSRLQALQIAYAGKRHPFPFSRPLTLFC